MITVIAVINAPSIGFLLDHIQEGPSASLSEYITVFSILIATLVIALIAVTFFIKETYCKSAVDFTILKSKSITVGVKNNY